MKSPFLVQMNDLLNSCTRRTEEFAGGLSEAQLNWRPGEGRWSVAECLDHLLVTNALYLGCMERAIHRAHAKGKSAEESTHSRNTIFGGFIIRTLKGGRAKAVPAPRMFSPASDITPGIVDRFVKSQVRLTEAMHDAEGLHLDRVKFGTPVSALLRANLGEAFELLVLHEARHLDQAEEVIATDGFPAS